MEFDNTDRGVLFKNDHKQKETQADYKGTLNVGGREFRISAWVKESKAGAKFMSLAVTAKEAMPERKASKPYPSLASKNLDAPF
jgi:hypothetical protein